MHYAGFQEYMQCTRTSNFTQFKFILCFKHYCIELIILVLYYMCLYNSEMYS